MAETQFEQFLHEQLAKYKDSMVPVAASFPERLVVRSLRCSALHPNPDDEFCVPEIGPNYQIIQDYIHKIKQHGSLQMFADYEPLIVQKVRPDGYMILNGHHRWAAAIRSDLQKVPVLIVNLTQETDLKKMLQHARHDKRVTFDLDEVIFCEEDDPAAEPPLPFPHSLFFKDRIRKGVPALMHYLTKQGYDIWIYTARYYSFDYLHAYFIRYSVNVTGVVTGVARKTKKMDAAQTRIRKMFTEQYPRTLHIDNHGILLTSKNQKDFQEYMLDCQPSDWSATVISILKNMEEAQ